MMSSYQSRHDLKLCSHHKFYYTREIIFALVKCRCHRLPLFEIFASFLCYCGGSDVCVCVCVYKKMGQACKLLNNTISQRCSNQWQQYGQFFGNGLRCLNWRQLTIFMVVCDLIVVFCLSFGFSTCPPATFLM